MMNLYLKRVREPVSNSQTDNGNQKETNYKTNTLKIEEWEPKKEKMNILLLCIIAFLVILIFSPMASPIYKYNFGYDSIQYKLAGKAILNGHIPFRDIFHQKGASFFFIQALAELIGKLLNNYQIGTFIIEIINLAVITYFLYRISRLFLGRTWSFYVVLSSLCYLVACFEGGNLTEEFALPWSYASVFITTKYIADIGKSNDSNYRHKVFYGLMQGICLAFTFWIRVNNCVIVCGCIAFTVIYLCIKKQIINMIQNAGAVISGMLIVTIPIMFYYYANGALDDMIYGNILVNMSYIAKNATTLKQNVLYLSVLLCPIVSSCIILLKGGKNNLLAGLCLCIVTITLIMYSIISVTYAHYAQFIMPCISIFLVLIIREINPSNFGTLIRKPFIYLFAAFIITSAPYIYRFAVECRGMYLRGTSYTGANMEVVSFASEMKQVIPDTQRDRVYAFGNSSAPIYYLSDTYQFYKYNDAGWLEYFGQVNAANEFYNVFEKTPPLWIAVKEEDLKRDARDIKYIVSKLEAEYDFVFSKNGYILYKYIIDTNKSYSIMSL